MYIHSYIPNNKPSWAPWAHGAHGAQGAQADGLPAGRQSLRPALVARAKQCITINFVLTVRCFIDFSSHWGAGAPQTPAFKLRGLRPPRPPNGGLGAAIKSAKFAA